MGRSDGKEVEEVLRGIIGNHHDTGPAGNGRDEASPCDHGVGKDEQQGRKAEPCGIRSAVLKRAVQHARDDESVDGDARAFGRIGGAGNDADEQKQQQGRQHRPDKRPGRKLRLRQEVAHVGSVRQSEKQHLRNEHPPGARRIADSRQQECRADRNQRFQPEIKERQRQQQDRISDLVGNHRRLGKEQRGAGCEKQRGQAERSGGSLHGFGKKAACTYEQAASIMVNKLVGMTVAGVYPHRDATSGIRIGINRGPERHTAVRTAR